MADPGRAAGSLSPARRRVHRRPSIALVTILLLVAVVLGEVGITVASRIPACAFTPAGGCTRILFIGNSYTSVNDLPGTFARLAGSGGHPVETGMIAPGGAFLADEVASPDVAGTMVGTGWTAIVLQEQSQRPASASEAGSLFLPAVAQLAAMAVADRARPLLLETWAHRDGWPEMHQVYVSMQGAINLAYGEASAQSGAELVPVGEVWQRVVATDPSLALWQDDGSHPTPAGTYLAACVLYRVVFGTSPVALGDHEGLPGVATELQQAATGG